MKTAMSSLSRLAPHATGTYMLAAAGLPLALALAMACGSSSGSGPGASTTDDAGPDACAPCMYDMPDGGGTMPGTDAGGHTPDGGGTPPTDGAASCVPSIPQIAWTSPYAGWSRGIPSDPKFFPISVWLQGSWHATEMAQLGINIYVGNNAGTDPLAASDLATLKSAGIYAILGQDSVGLASIDDPTIVGWWMNPDEPDNAQPDDGGYGPPVDPSTLVAQYQSYKAADSTRPIFVGLGQGVAYDAWEGRGSNAPPESGYVPASDIIDFDIYPYNNCGGDANEQATCAQFWLNAFGVDRLHMWSNRNQAVWTDIETTIIGAGTTTGPTPTQTKSEVWLSLIHEANGITYFVDTWNPSFREDGIFASPTMVTAVTALNQQIESLAPELNSASLPSLVKVTSASSTTTIDTMVKANGTTLYIFSAVSRAGTTMGSYAIQGMTGSATATVVGENRTVSVKAGQFSDAFAANDVHIYSIDLSKVTCN
jgi:hypothetical protein